MKAILTFILLCSASSLANSQIVLLDNDFSTPASVTRFDGPNGEELGTDAVLGNATSNRDLDVGGGQADQGNNEFYSFRSRSAAPITRKTSFIGDFVFTAMTLTDGNTDDGLFGVGWGTVASGGGASTDGAGLFNSNLTLNVGLAATGDGSGGSSVSNTSVTFYAFDRGVSNANTSAVGSNMTLVDGST